MIKHRPIANINRYSCVSAIFFVSVGMINLLIRYNHPHNKAIFPSIIHPANNWFPSPLPLKVAKNTKSNITIISCIIRIHIESLPKVLSVSSWSDKSFKTTIVELNANQIPMYAEVTVSNPKI